MPDEINYMKKHMPKNWMRRYYLSKFLMKHRERISWGLLWLPIAIIPVLWILLRNGLLR